MRFTAKDVAKRAGVSQTTVSRVLNGHHYINVDTKEKVLKAVKELGYHPNHVARSMALRKTNALGLIVSDIVNSFYSEIAKNIIDEAKELGYEIILCNTDHVQSVQNFYIEFLQQRRVDGIIFASIKLKDKKAEELIANNYPVIFINSRLKLKKASFIVTDNKQGAKLAVSHFLDLGHKKIGYISGPDTISTAYERFLGYQETLHEAGLAVNSDYVKDQSFSPKYAYQATQELLKMQAPPTAIFVTNDVMAFKVMEAILDMGLSIPEDVAIIGYDDVVMSSHKRIGLTTVAQDKSRIGRLAVEGLIQMIDKGPDNIKPIHTLLEPQLIIRNTCGYRK
ncbi:LacI family DNA-binding transcriptional regulator [Desulfitibacter alkalitolerans]|uniref:LacI family DNA-binding transcriptional regulator n=1 Tax=Desulfitibacter alkalitolerans TaxID=264641 RepID=UPI00055375F7|nr:LacI family DNA-binding transcriptional regulator [Desulfitibacter alkalitolerans]